MDKIKIIIIACIRGIIIIVIVSVFTIIICICNYMGLTYENNKQGTKVYELGQEKRNSFAILTIIIAMFFYSSHSSSPRINQHA